MNVSSYGVAKGINPDDLQRRERRSTVFACVAIGILAGGTALLMYPVVFSTQNPSSDKTLRIAFFGFCGLCVLLTAYIWDRQATITRLRRQMESDRKLIEKVRGQAAAELLRNIPKLGSFQDLLAMECRRTIATFKNLSVLVVTVQSSEESGSPTMQISILGDAAKAISRKLRDQDSTFLLGRVTFGIVLPGVNSAMAEGISARVAEGLADAAGAGGRFSYKLGIVNYPQDASSAHEMERVVNALIPPDNSIGALPEEVLA
jgi:hypothetical protein